MTDGNVKTFYHPCRFRLANREKNVKGKIIIKMVLKVMTSKLLSVSFSIWPEYLSDEQYTLEFLYKTNKKKRQVFFLVRSENKREKS